MKGLGDLLCVALLFTLDEIDQVQTAPSAVNVTRIVNTTQLVDRLKDLLHQRQAIEQKVSAIFLLTLGLTRSRNLYQKLALQLCSIFDASRGFYPCTWWAQ